MYLNESDIITPKMQSYVWLIEKKVKVKKKKEWKLK